MSYLVMIYFSSIIIVTVVQNFNETELNETVHLIEISSRWKDQKCKLNETVGNQVMSAMDEFRNLITTIVRSSKNGTIGFQDLETSYFQIEGVTLKQAAQSVGCKSGVLDLMRNWHSDVIVFGKRSTPTIYAVKTDPISDTNQRS